MIIIKRTLLDLLTLVALPVRGTTTLFLASPGEGEAPASGDDDDGTGGGPSRRSSPSWLAGGLGMAMPRQS